MPQTTVEQAPTHQQQPLNAAMEDRFISRDMKRVEAIDQKQNRKEARVA